MALPGIRDSFVPSCELFWDSLAPVLSLWIEYCLADVPNNVLRALPARRYIIRGGGSAFGDVFKLLEMRCIPLLRFHSQQIVCQGCQMTLQSDVTSLQRDLIRWKPELFGTSSVHAWHGKG